MISLFYVHIGQICALRFSLRSWWPGGFHDDGGRRWAIARVGSSAIAVVGIPLTWGAPLAKAHMLAWSVCMAAAEISPVCRVFFGQPASL